MATGAPHFQEALSRELILADRLRTIAVLVAMGAGLLFSMLLIRTIPPEALRVGVSRLELSSVLLVGALAILGELGVLWQIRRVARGEARALHWGAYVVVSFETLLTPAILLLMSSLLADENVLSSPVVLLYSVTIVTTSLRLDPRLSLYAGALSAATYLLLARWLIGEGLVIPPANSGMATFYARAFYLLMTGAATSFVAYQLRERFRHAAEAQEQRSWVVGVFGRYLSDDVVDVLINDPDGLKLGGVKGSVTLLMTDLRGFSNISEHREPDQVVDLLNHYLGAMTAVIARHGGTIDEFIGDAILVIWNAPLNQPDHAARAVRCALEMQREMEVVNAWNRERGYPEIQMGVGVHTGDVVVGNIGSPQRQKYGVVGAAVNLTARVESYTVGGQVLITEATAALVGEGLDVASAREVFPKGASTAVRLLDVVGLGALRLPQRSSRLTAIAPLAVEVRRLMGKDLPPTGSPGELVGLSADEADLRVPEALEPWQNVALSWGGGLAFAKVIAVAETARLRFTSLDEAATAARDAALAAAESKPAE